MAKRRTKRDRVREEPTAYAGSVGAEEARTRLPELLELAHGGSSTVITRHGRPYAALVPLEDARRARGGGARIMRLKGTGAGCWDDPLTWTGRERDAW